MAAPNSPDPLVALRGRRVVLGVTGGIAAYKVVDVCRQLVDAGAHVVPVLTDDAQRFVGALTFSALASEPARTSLFEGPDPIPHTQLGRRADLVVVAPATAKVIGKYTHGISDDLLTAMLLATKAPVLLAPAMHTEMWEHAAVQDNLAVLRERGVHVVDPEEGRLAGGDTGPGRLADPARIVAAAADVLAGAGDLAGLRVLVTAGGTREPIDPVRFVGNRSSGKMGYAIAESAARRGAAVTLVTTIGRPTDESGITIEHVETADDMARAVLSRFTDADVVVMAAAVADFRPKAVADEKLKKRDGVPEVVLEPTPDVLAELGERKIPGQLLVGFAAETEHVEQHAAEKMASKRVDMMVANDVSAADSGFEVDTNRAILLYSSGSREETPLLDKRELADLLLDRVAAVLADDPTGAKRAR
ncbi:MAG TPA: bifunctional phosphopantothenoylcysteine decarboxylase/phosphopantothenate--cysteine ligase CoaBC [Acidimicrobiia bacterium]|jgi:phosphopantothenoylcysteine decarboxylase/phosphopantothenate--cysteine ligase|nr:bifunctional phosphopantothenoylcysteine decarboxylase/phosphopantothenate--cysteine ligase CoaBC [Acidimicrobiia bacterium]